jgi:hypothetical protein
VALKSSNKLSLKNCCRKAISAISIIIISGGILTGCGTNTETPIYPLLAVLTPVGTPVIIAVRPVESILTGDYRIQFEIDYYVTNTENEFAGYNLYISSLTESPDARTSGTPYLPAGIMPSFYHTSSEADTSSESLVTQSVLYANAPPDQINFQLCEKYYFSLAAYSTTGNTSFKSLQKSACAVIDRSLCPVDSICYCAPGKTCKLVP